MMGATYTGHASTEFTANATSVSALDACDCGRCHRSSRLALDKLDDELYLFLNKIQQIIYVDVSVNRCPYDILQIIESR